VELDGSQHGERAAYDEQRTATLAKLGVTVVRFWNVELKEPEFVWRRLQSTIAELRTQRAR
jgi:very-short-patch-repair endonuclease